MSSRPLSDPHSPPESAPEFPPPNHVSTTLDKHQHVVCEDAPFAGGFAIDLFPCVVELILIEDLSERSGCGGIGTVFDATGQRRRWNPGDCHDAQTDSTYDGSSDMFHRRLRICSLGQREKQFRPLTYINQNDTR